MRGIAWRSVPAHHFDAPDVARPRADGEEEAASVGRELRPVGLVGLVEGYQEARRPTGGRHRPETRPALLIERLEVQRPAIGRPLDDLRSHPGPGVRWRRDQDTGRAPCRADESDTP